jgi:hypothetical protein
MLGGSIERLIGLSAEIVHVPPQAFTDPNRTFIQGVLEGERFETAVPMKRRDGSMFWYRRLVQAAIRRTAAKMRYLLPSGVRQTRHCCARNDP